MGGDDDDDDEDEGVDDDENDVPFHQERQEEPTEEVNVEEYEVTQVERPSSRELLSRPVSGRTRTATSRLFDDAATVSWGSAPSSF